MKNSIELKVPDYYLEMDGCTMAEYCKLAKMTQKDKHKKAVLALLTTYQPIPVPKRKVVQTAPLSIKAKAFHPKGPLSGLKRKKMSFDVSLIKRSDIPSSGCQIPGEYSTAILNDLRPLKCVKVEA